MTKFQTLLASRKFWAALIGLLLIIVKAFRPDFPLTADQTTSVVVILVGYILGTAIQDSSIAQPTILISPKTSPPEDPAPRPPAPGQS